MPRPPKPVMDRLMARVIVTASGCWIYTGPLNHGGYGVISIGQRTDGRSIQRRAHRVAYEHLVGPIPDGLTLDHLCRTPACVNPSHLEPVTAAENIKRAAASITTCAQGHPYDASNTIRRRDGRRRCRECNRVRVALWRAAKKESA